MTLYIDFAPSSPPASISWTTTLSQFYTIRTFTWNTPSPGCPNIHYNILASNCGSCPTTTNHTTVTCTNVPMESTCTFAVRTIICVNITGESNQVSVFNYNNVPGQFKYPTQAYSAEFIFTLIIILMIGSTECTCRSDSVLISAVCLGVALAICLTGLITVIVLLIKSKTKVGSVVANSTVVVDKVQSRSTQSSGINTKNNISYIVHSPKLNQL
jgi:hypothetical protein